MMGTSVNVVHGLACPEIGPICTVRKELPQLHDQDFLIGEVRAVLDQGLGHGFGAEVHLPLRVSHTAIVYRRVDGTAFTLDYPNIHHRNETLTGIGDPWLLGRWAGDVGEFTLSVKTGLTLPLGSTVVNPFRLAAGGREHQHIQFGTGTFDPLLAAGASRKVGPVAVALYGQARLGLYANDAGYQAGHRFGFGLSAGMAVWREWTATTSADLAIEQAERWDGKVMEDGNLGRTDGLLGLGLSHPLGPFRLGLAAKVPLFTLLVQHGDEAAQLEYPAIVEFSVQWQQAPDGPTVAKERGKSAMAEASDGGMLRARFRAGQR